MKKIFYLYLGQVFERFQQYGLIAWYASLTVATLSLASMIGVTQPAYYSTSVMIYQLALKVFIYSSLLYILPTKEFMKAYVGIALMDDTARTGLLFKASRAVKKFSGNRISPKQLYSKYLKKKYLNWVYAALYVWDLRKLKTQLKVLLYIGYAALVFITVNYLMSFVTKPFYFDKALHEIAIGALIFIGSSVIKMMFIPSIETLKDMLSVWILGRLNKAEWVKEEQEDESV